MQDNSEWQIDIQSVIKKLFTGKNIILIIILTLFGLIVGLIAYPSVAKNINFEVKVEILPTTELQNPMSAYMTSDAMLREFAMAIRSIKNKYVGDSSIHPHQTHFEIISELGLIGYIFFISVFFFILLQSLKSYLRERDNLKLCGILFIIISLAPLLPSGSFFTTYGAALFWFNLSFILPKNT